MELPRAVPGASGFRLPRGKGGIILLVVVLVAGYYGGFNWPCLIAQPPAAAVDASDKPQ